MITVLVISMIGIILGTILNVYFYRNSERYNKDLFSPNNIAISLTFILIIASALFTNINEETLIDFNIIEVIFAILSLPVLGFLSYLYYNEKTNRISYSTSIIILSAILTYLMPNQNMILPEKYGVFFDKLSVFSSILAITYLFIYNNSYRLIQNLHYIFIGTGIFICYIFGAVGLFIGAIALIIATNNFTAFLFNHKSEADEYQNKIFNLPFAFLMSWIFVRIIGEELWSLPICLSSYLIISFVFAILYATINFDKFWRNNNYNLPNLFAKNHIPRNSIVNVCFRNYLFILIFSISSVFTSSAYGFLMIISVYVVWNSYKSINWEKKDRSIKEINNDFIEQLKENLFNTKDAINTITKDDNKKND